MNSPLDTGMQCYICNTTLELQSQYYSSDTNPITSGQYDDPGDEFGIVEFACPKCGTVVSLVLPSKNAIAEGSEEMQEVWRDFIKQTS